MFLDLQFCAGLYMWKLKNNKESKKTNGLLIGGSYVFSSKQMAYMLYPLDEMKKKRVCFAL